MLLNERGGEGAREFQPLWDGKQVPLNCLIILLPLTVLIKPAPTYVSLALTFLPTTQ